MWQNPFVERVLLDILTLILPTALVIVCAIWSEASNGFQVFLIFNVADTWADYRAILIVYYDAVTLRVVKAWLLFSNEYFYRHRKKYNILQRNDAIVQRKNA